ncbi:UDP-N-acetylenolpyruvoylglucosamine reductase [Clostridia bacterium]|nr:UDP-N-acetylenolpyruvoylglucosamine reductase [Clostridia bacterium]
MNQTDFARMLSRLRALHGEAALLLNEPLSKWTTMRVGGPADALFMPRYDYELLSALRTAREFDIPITIIGNGSNLIVRDGGIRGLTIRICARHDDGDSPTGKLWDVKLDGYHLITGAGALLSAVANAATAAGLSGMEALSGIPGTVGGAALMNAGAYEHEMSQVVQSVDAISWNGSSYEHNNYTGTTLNYRYRGSAMMDDSAVITRVTMLLQPDDPAIIKERIADYTQRRKSKQPLTVPSAGSFFKRPPGHFAGKLIEDAGLKGYAVGGAMISPMHAGFVVNNGGATASDIITLMNNVVERVQQNSGVTLEPEVRIIGEDVSP